MTVTVLPTFKSIVDTLRVMSVIVVVTETEEELGAVGELLSPLHATSRVVPTIRCKSCLVKSCSNDDLHEFKTSTELGWSHMSAVRRDESSIVEPHRR